MILRKKAGDREDNLSALKESVVSIEMWTMANQQRMLQRLPRARRYLWQINTSMHQKDSLKDIYSMNDDINSSADGQNQSS
jgi:hypothetical protein